MRVLAGLGEGIGNVVMGLPLLDALHAAGHEVTLHLLPSPPEIENELMLVVAAGRRWLQVASDEGLRVQSWDAACLTHWWLSRCSTLPRADEHLAGEPPRGAPPLYDPDCPPEILSNLAAAGTLLGDAQPATRAVLHAIRAPLRPLEGRRPVVALHPGCKPAWRAAKVYPRWAEVTHRLKQAGADVWIVGTDSDDAYCGEPRIDLRGSTADLGTLVAMLAGVDCLVSGDSGLHHVAVALGTPTVALFGGSSVSKARHPDPIFTPVVFESQTWEIDPRAVAEACLGSVRRRVFLATELGAVKPPGSEPVGATLPA